MIINNDCLDEMRKMEANSVSCIVTDPPYGLHFMGKDWDSFKFKPSCNAKKERRSRARTVISDGDGSYLAGTYDDRRNDEFQSFIYEFGIEALRIVKPGGHILMFGAPRRYHRQTCGLEDAGWEIRDCLMWVFGSGFPKSHNHFGIPGFGTALKPAYEPIIMAMKPCDGTFKENAETWGQAGINIDACRIEAQDQEAFAKNWDRETVSDMRGGNFKTSIPGGIPMYKEAPKGRWPANILFDEESANLLDEQAQDSVHASGRSTAGDHSGSMFSGLKDSDYGKRVDYPDSGGASRFFYCAKTSSRERNEGLEGLPEKVSNPNFGSGGFSRPTDQPERETKPVKNHHPTVKPLKLMRYLITLVMPPKDGVLLDPFAGSGSTIVAAHQLGLKAIGIEKSADYCEIARKRLENVTVIRKEENPQMDFLDGTYDHK